MVAVIWLSGSVTAAFASSVFWRLMISWNWFAIQVTPHGVVLVMVSVGVPGAPDGEHVAEIVALAHCQGTVISGTPWFISSTKIPNSGCDEDTKKSGLPLKLAMSPACTGQSVMSNWPEVKSENIAPKSL
jgi:hypothetical protein